MLKLWLAITHTGYVTVKANTKGEAMVKVLKEGVKPIAIKSYTNL